MPGHSRQLFGGNMCDKTIKKHRNIPNQHPNQHHKIPSGSNGLLTPSQPGLHDHGTQTGCLRGSMPKPRNSNSNCGIRW